MDYLKDDIHHSKFSDTLEVQIQDISSEGVLILKFKNKIENISIVDKYSHNELIDMHI